MVSPENMYMSNIIQSEQAMFMYIYIRTCVCIHDLQLHTVLYTHTYMHVMPIQDKEVMNLKESKEE